MSLTSSSSFEEILASENGAFANMTQEQIESFRNAFKHLDDNGDGVLSLAEIQQMFSKLGLNKSEDDLKSIISEIDTNNDGSISFVEFLYIMKTGADNNEFIKACKSL